MKQLALGFDTKKRKKSLILKKFDENLMKITLISLHCQLFTNTRTNHSPDTNLISFLTKSSNEIFTNFSVYINVHMSIWTMIDVADALQIE